MGVSEKVQNNNIPVRPRNQEDLGALSVSERLSLSESEMVGKS